MSWKITIPGQPISGNHATKIGRGYRRGGISYAKIVKTPEAEAYQQGIAYIVRTSKPRDWHGNDRFVVCEYYFYLWDDLDCTNAIKVIEDGIFPALGINDRWALPRAMEKHHVSKAEARVEVIIE